jgi:HAD superfamily hydrolase (TIGR01490 family)
MSGQPRSLAIAAFFDLDGTMVPRPSLERRLVGALLYRHAIPASGLVRWPIEFLRLARRGFTYARHANKMHFRGILAEQLAALARQLTARRRVLFFPQALERVAWHAARGHAIVLVSGTPNELARSAAWSLAGEVLKRDLTATIFVRATDLEMVSGRSTGRVQGEPVFGRAKALAVEAFSLELGLNLAACYAYGDSIHDRAMLERVGHPLAVNPSPSLERLARARNWPSVRWAWPAQSASRLAGCNTPFMKENVENLG